MMTEFLFGITLNLMYFDMQYIVTPLVHYNILFIIFVNKFVNSFRACQSGSIVFFVHFEQHEGK